MDPALNPFAPGAGTEPPELAGRADLINEATTALARVKSGRSAQSQFLLGLRGVGKTVLLNRVARVADEQGYQTIVLEAPEDRRLAEMLVPPLRSLLFRLSGTEKAKQYAKAALGVLRSFASAFKVAAGEVEFSVEAQVGQADSGDLEFDLPQLFTAVAEAAREAGGAYALFIDEVQYLSEADLSALIVAVHKLGQKGLPFILFGAGLPQLAALAGEAKSYAERLFSYPEVGALAPDAAREAIEEPLRRSDVSITGAALDAIVDVTKGYPYFLQEWGAQAWNVAAGSTIDERDVVKATSVTVARLDRSFFRVRLDRLTPREKDYMRAMAELGAGPHGSGEIAEELNITVNKAAPLRDGLIRKGMIYSPRHGQTAFTVPLFDEFMRRSLPEWTRPEPKPRKS